MKLLLLNDAGIPIACYDDFQQYAERSPAHTFALLDLVEKLIESVDGNLGDASWSCDENPMSAGSPSGPGGAPVAARCGDASPTQELAL